MPDFLRSWRAAAAGFCGRHPLCMAALVAVACVVAVSRGWPAGLVVGAIAGAVGWALRGWRTGIAWCACGWIAAAVFLIRDADRRSDERVFLAAGGAMVHGRVLKDARGTDTFWRAPVSLRDGPRPGAKVWWQGVGELPVAGSRVSARGNFRPLEPARNPGEFDQATWLRRQGVSAVFQASRANASVSTGKLAALGATIRRGFRTAVTDGLPAESRQAAVIRAVVLGEAPQDAEALIAAFRNSGTLHAFSVSGLHVSMVGMIAWLLLRTCGLSRRRAVLAILPLIFGYSWLTGNSPPAVRSAWMAAVFLGAFAARRRPDLLNALGAVLLVAMLWDGRLLFQPGVQLSYGVVAAIAVGAGWGTRVFSRIAAAEPYLPRRQIGRWRKMGHGLRRGVAQSLGVSLVAGVGSAPLTAYHFGLLTPISVVAGVVFVPFVFALLCASLLAAAIHPLVPPAARWINRANGAIFADGCVFVAETFASIPGGHFQIRPETRPFLLIYDIGHGSGAAVFSDGKKAAALIDCGSSSSFKRRIAPSLRRLVVTPDLVVLSHPDGHHLGGGAQVWEQFPIRQVLLPVPEARSPAFRAWLQDAPRAGVKTFQAADFQDIAFPDGARLEILHVADPAAPLAIADERVALFRLHWQGWKILFTSDAGLGTEMDAIDSGRDLTADVIVAGRHASDTSLSDSFLDAVQPRAIVASHADYPPEEQLAPDTVAYWRSRGLQVFHQGVTGGVTIRVDPSGNLRLEGFADGSVVILNRR